MLEFHNVRSMRYWIVVLAVAIAVENAGYGGAVAAPIAKEVLKAYFGGTKTATPPAAAPPTRPQ